MRWSIILFLERLERCYELLYAKLDEIFGLLYKLLERALFVCHKSVFTLRKIAITQAINPDFSCS